MDSMNEVERKIENIVGAVYNHGFLTAKEGTDRLLKSPNTEMPIAVAKQELSTLIQEERQGAVRGFVEFLTVGHTPIHRYDRDYTDDTILSAMNFFLKSLEDKDVLTDGGKHE